MKTGSKLTPSLPQGSSVSQTNFPTLESLMAWANNNQADLPKKVGITLYFTTKTGARKNRWYGTLVKGETGAYSFIKE